MRVLIAGIVSAALAAIPTSVASGGASSGLDGKVLRGAMSPACLTARPCQVGASIVLAFSRHGTTVAQVKSAPTGDYRIGLAPGVYTVTPARRARLWRVSPQTVRVPVGGYRRVDFLVDTGIR
jgi:hypothetical protein